MASENEKIAEVVKKIKMEYEWFLNLRQSMDNGFDEESKRKEAFLRADRFHELIVHELISQLAQDYPQLRNKTDRF